ncbi:MAG: tetratricopeptide repeat protein [Anaerolineae bacterium]
MDSGERGAIGRMVMGGLAFLLVLAAVRVAGGALVANVWAADGRRFDQAGQWQESIEKYDRAIALVPWQGTYYQFRGEAFYNLARALPPEQAALQGELLTAAARSLAWARAFEPLEMEHYTNSGVLYAYWSELEPDRLETAVQFYEQAFRLAPTRVELRRDLGHVYHNNGRYAEALAQYDIGIGIDPADEALYRDAALAAEALGDEALADLYRDKAEERE